MTVEIIRPNTVSAPTPEKRKSTLLDVATVVSSTNWLFDGDDLFESINCLTARFWDTDCGATQDGKTFDGPTWIDSIKAASYMGLKCDPIGIGDLPNMVGPVFDRIESNGVEQALMERILGVQDDAPANATPVPVEVGIALLEDHAARHYAGLPTLHLTPAAASLYGVHNGALDWDGNILRTKLGSKVAVGGGYSTANQGPEADAPATGNAWLWATGEVVVLQGTIQSHNELNRTNNDNRLLVERDFIVAIDCYAAAVEVEIIPA